MTIHLMQPNDILTIEAHNADTQIVNGFLKHYHQGHCTSGGGASTAKGLPLSKGKASLVHTQGHCTNTRDHNRLMVLMELVHFHQDAKDALIASC